MKDTPLKICFAFVFSLIGFCPITFAQGYSIQGQVLDSVENKLTGYALLLSKDQQKLVKGNVVENGYFQFSVDSTGDYTLQISSLGFSEHKILLNINPQQNRYDVGVIILAVASNTLQEVSITARKSLFEKTLDGTRLNVENTLLSKSVNAMELLSKSPGISITSGKVNVFGRGEAMILLSGREIPLETFKSLPPGEIKSIEIITNPSAKHDAKGKAIILVNMKKSYQQGLQTTLSESATLGRHFMNNANVSISLKKDRLNLSTYYANELGTTWSKNVYSTAIKAAQGLYNSYGVYEEHPRSSSVHNYRMGLAYTLNEKSDLSAQYDGLYNFFELDVRQDGDFYTPSQELTRIQMRNAATTTLINHSGNLNYNLRLDSLGSNLFVALQYNRFENRLLDSIEENITTPEQSTSTAQRINDSNNLIHLFIAQSDWSKALNADHKLEMGLKYAQISNRGRIRFLSKPLESPNFIEYQQYANGTLYEESISAAYALLTGKQQKWSYNLGLRAENANAYGFSQKLQQSIIDTNYLKLFPSAKLAYQINNNWSSNITFARKINRPLYQDLDPFLWYLDSLTYIQGNPGLVPETLNQLEWSIAFKSYSFKVAYTHSDQTIWAVTKTGFAGPNSVVYVKDNIQQRHIFTLSMDVPFESKHYNTYNTFAYNFYRFEDNRREFSIGKTSPQFYWYTYHQFLFPKLFNIDLSGEYYGATADGFTQRKPYYYLTLGLSRNFLHNKLNSQLMFNDFLRTARFMGHRSIGTINNDYNQRINSHYLRLTLTYQWGAVKNFKYNNKAINEKEFGRIKQ